MHEMAEKCATAIKNEFAPSKKTEKKANTQMENPFSSTHSVELCVEKKSERVIIMRRSRIRICQNGLLYDEFRV